MPSFARTQSADNLSQLVRRILRSRYAIPVAALSAPGLAFAGPMGGNVIHGDVDITGDDDTTLIHQASARAIVNWNSFSVDADEFVIFNQPDASAVILNRVIGSDLSVIYGTIESNGQVFLVNPNGLFFGEGATLDVQGLVATTLDIADADFIAGNYVFTKGDGAADAAVVNAGAINAGDGGYVVLAGDYTDNSGVIAASLGHVVLASGSQVTLDLAGDGLVGFAVDTATVAALAGVNNSGDLLADGGMVIMTADVARDLVTTVVNNDGLVRAASVEERNGVVYLAAAGGDIEVGGALAADGGGRVILRGAHDVTLADGASVSANGGGGMVRAIAGGRLDLQQGATISATGGGGFVEVSGDRLSLRGAVDLGGDGQLLIDPATLTINAGAGAPGLNTSSSPYGGTVGVDFITGQLDANADVLLVASDHIGVNGVTAINATGSGDLTVGIGGVSSVATGSGYGDCVDFGVCAGGIATFSPSGSASDAIDLSGVDITIAGDFNADAGYGEVTLRSVTAAGITVDAGMLSAGSGNLALLADTIDLNVDGITASNGSVNLTAVSGNLNVDFDITATGNIALNYTGTNSSHGVFVTPGGADADAGSGGGLVSHDTSITLDAGGDIIIDAGGYGVASIRAGVARADISFGVGTASASANTTLDADGDISITGANVELAGGSASANGYSSGEANAHANLTVGAGGVLDLTALASSGTVSISGGDAVGDAYFEGQATASARADVTGGSIAITGPSIRINGGAASVLASGDDSGDASAYAGVALSATTGDIDIHAASSGDATISAGPAYARAASGTAVADASVVIDTVTGDASVTGGSVTLRGAEVSATAVDGGQATANASVAVKPAGALTLTALDSSGTVEIIGGLVYADAYGGSAGRAEARSEIDVEATSVAIVGPSVRVSGGDADASASSSFNKGTAYAGVVIATTVGDLDLVAGTDGSARVVAGAADAGANSGSAYAYANVDLSAAGDVAVAGRNVWLRGGTDSSNSAGAYATATSSGTAVAEANLSVHAGVAVTLTGGAGLSSSASVGRGSAFAGAWSGGNANASARVDVTADTGAVTISGGRLYVEGGSAEADASSATATADAGRSLTATAGDIDISAEYGAGVYAGSASADASSGAATARADVVLDAASGNISITGDSVSFYGGSEISASGGYSGDAVASGNLSATAGGAFTLTAHAEGYGEVAIGGGSADASADFSYGDASASARVDVDAASIAISGPNVRIAGGYASASASGSSVMAADAGVRLTASGDFDVTASAPYGSVAVYAGRADAFAWASSSVMAHAVARADVALDAGGALTLTAEGDVYLGGDGESGGEAEVAAYAGSGWADAEASAALSIEAAGAITISGENVTIAGGRGRSEESPAAAASGSTASAVADVDVGVDIAAGGDLSMTAMGSSVDISGGRLDFEAYAGDGAAATVTGDAAVILSAGGALAVTVHGDTSSHSGMTFTEGSLEISAGSATAYAGANGGTVTMDLDAGVDLSGVSMTLTGPDVYVSGGQAGEPFGGSLYGGSPASIQASGGSSYAGVADVTLDAGTSLIATNGITIAASSDVNLGAGMAYGGAAAYGGGAVANLTADASLLIDAGAGALMVTATGTSDSEDEAGVDIYGGTTGFSAFAGSGDVTATALASATLRGGTITVTGPNIGVAGGAGFPLAREAEAFSGTASGLGDGRLVIEADGDITFAGDEIELGMGFGIGRDLQAFAVGSSGGSSPATVHATDLGGTRIAAGGDLVIDAVDYASVATGFEHGGSMSAGAYNGAAIVDIDASLDLSAVGDMRITADSVSIYGGIATAHGASARALGYGSIGHGSVDVTIDTAARLQAGGAVEIGAESDLSIYGGAYAASSVGVEASGDAVADLLVEAGVELAAVGAVTLSAGDDLEIAGGSGAAYASSEASSTGVFANDGGSATANVDVGVAISGANLTVAGGAVGIYGGSSLATGSSSLRVSAYGGDATLTVDAGVSLLATQDFAIEGTTVELIGGESAGSALVASAHEGNATVALDTSVTVVAGGALTIHATGGSSTWSTGSSTWVGEIEIAGGSDAGGMDVSAGHGGVAAATVDAGVQVDAATITLSGGSLWVAGGEWASASAYADSDGAATTTVSTSVDLSATDITLDFTDSVEFSGGYGAVASASTSGSSATADATVASTVSIDASGNLSVVGGGIAVYGGGASSGNGSLDVGTTLQGGAIRLVSGGDLELEPAVIIAGSGGVAGFGTADAALYAQAGLTGVTAPSLQLVSGGTAFLGQTTVAGNLVYLQVADLEPGAFVFDAPAGVVVQFVAYGDDALGLVAGTEAAGGDGVFEYPLDSVRTLIDSTTLIFGSTQQTGNVVIGDAVDGTGLTLLFASAGTVSGGTVAADALGFHGATIDVSTDAADLWFDGGAVSADNSAFTGAATAAFGSGAFGAVGLEFGGNGALTGPLSAASLDVSAAGNLGIGGAVLTITGAAVFEAGGDISNVDGTSVSADALAMQAGGDILVGETVFTVGDGAVTGFAGDPTLVTALTDAGLYDGAAAPSANFVAGGAVELGAMTLSGTYLYVEAASVEFAGAVTAAGELLAQLVPADATDVIGLESTLAAHGGTNFGNTQHLAKFPTATVALGATGHSGGAVVGQDGVFDIGSADLVIVSTGDVAGLGLVATTGTLAVLDGVALAVVQPEPEPEPEEPEPEEPEPEEPEPEEPEPEEPEPDNGGFEPPINDDFEQGPDDDGFDGPQFDEFAGGGGGGGGDDLWSIEGDDDDVIDGLTGDGDIDMGGGTQDTDDEEDDDEEDEEDEEDGGEDSGAGT